LSLTGYLDISVYEEGKEGKGRERGWRGRDE
jgi:hypothetical protein